jgi:hypothetical protein
MVDDDLHQVEHLEPAAELESDCGSVVRKGHVAGHCALQSRLTTIPRIDGETNRKLQKKRGTAYARVSFEEVV